MLTCLQRITRLLLGDQDGAELTECLLLMEISNPFLHARYFLKVGFQIIAVQNFRSSVVACKCAVLSNTNLPFLHRGMATGTAELSLFGAYCTWCITDSSGVRCAGYGSQQVDGSNME